MKPSFIADMYCALWGLQIDRSPGDLDESVAKIFRKSKDKWSSGLASELVYFRAAVSDAFKDLTTERTDALFREIYDSILPDHPLLSACTDLPYYFYSIAAKQIESQGDKPLSYGAPAEVQLLHALTGKRAPEEIAFLQAEHLRDIPEEKKLLAAILLVTLPPSYVENAYFKGEEGYEKLLLLHRAQQRLDPEGKHTEEFVYLFNTDLALAKLKSLLVTSVPKKEDVLELIKCFQNTFGAELTSEDFGTYEYLEDCHNSNLLTSLYALTEIFPEVSQRRRFLKEVETFIDLETFVESAKEHGDQPEVLLFLLCKMYQDDLVALLDRKPAYLKRLVECASPYLTEETSLDSSNEFLAAATLGRQESLEAYCNGLYSIGFSSSENPFNSAVLHPYAAQLEQAFSRVSRYIVEGRPELNVPFLIALCALGNKPLPPTQEELLLQHLFTTPELQQSARKALKEEQRPLKKLQILAFCCRVNQECPIRAETLYMLRLSDTCWEELVWLATAASSFKDASLLLNKWINFKGERPTAITIAKALSGIQNPSVWIASAYSIAKNIEAERAICALLQHIPEREKQGAINAACTLAPKLSSNMIEQLRGATAEAIQILAAVPLPVATTFVDLSIDLEWKERTQYFVIAAKYLNNSLYLRSVLTLLPSIPPRCWKEAVGLIQQRVPAGHLLLLASAASCAHLSLEEAHRLHSKALDQLTINGLQQKRFPCLEHTPPHLPNVSLKPLLAWFDALPETAIFDHDGETVTREYAKKGLESLLECISTRTPHQAVPTKEEEREKWYATLHDLLAECVDAVNRGAASKETFYGEVARIAVAGHDCGYRWLGDAQIFNEQLSRVRDPNVCDIALLAARSVETLRRSSVSALVQKYVPIYGYCNYPHIQEALLRVITAAGHPAAYPMDPTDTYADNIEIRESADLLHYQMLCSNAKHFIAIEEALTVQENLSKVYDALSAHAEMQLQPQVKQIDAQFDAVALKKGRRKRTSMIEERNFLLGKETSLTPIQMQLVRKNGATPLPQGESPKRRKLEPAGEIAHLEKLSDEKLCELGRTDAGSEIKLRKLALTDDYLQREGLMREEDSYLVPTLNGIVTLLLARGIIPRKYWSENLARKLTFEGECTLITL